MEKLKLYPFCGSKNIRLCGITYHWVQCEKCLSATAMGCTKKEAVEH